MHHTVMLNHHHQLQSVNWRSLRISMQRNAMASDAAKSVKTRLLTVFGLNRYFLKDFSFLFALKSLKQASFKRM